MRSRVRRGAALLDAVAALAIVAMAASAALATLGAELRSASRVRSALIAEALGRERLATLRLQLSGATERLPDSLARGRFAAPFADYGWSTSTARVAPRSGGVADMLSLRLTIHWKDGVLPFATLLYRPPPPVRPR